MVTLTIEQREKVDACSASSVSVYVSGATGSSAGSGGAAGHWRVYEEAGKALLELSGSDGSREAIQLTAEGTKTFLNGRRWFVAGSNE